MAEGYYGYNPAQYANDFSWMGKIGDSLKQMASQVPEFLTLNREIKENNGFKQKSFAAANKFVDAMNPTVLHSVASSMGINYQTVDEAKQKLKEMIPKFSQDTKNEEYAKQVADSFFTPFVTHAFSEKGGKLSMGDILSNVDYGVLQDAIRSSSIGKEQLQTEQSQKDQEQQLDTQKKLTQQKYTFEQETGNKSANLINEAIKKAKTPDEAYNLVSNNKGSEEDANKAREYVRQRDLDAMNKKKDEDIFATEKLKKDQIDKADPETLPNLIVRASTVVGRINDDIQKLTDNKKKKGSGMTNEMFSSQMALLTNKLKIAEENQKALEIAQSEFLKSDGKTNEDIFKAQKFGEAVVNTEKNIRETPLPFGANTSSPEYNPMDITQIALSDARDQINKFKMPSKDFKGPLRLRDFDPLDPILKAYLKKYTSKNGITVSQYLQANNINYNDPDEKKIENNNNLNENKSDQNTTQVIDKDKQYLKAYNDPEFNTLPEDKKNIVIQYLKGRGLL